MPTDRIYNVAAETTCIHCGIKSATKTTCDGSSRKKAGCSNCKALNQVCFFRHNPKQTKTNSVGYIYHADPLLDIEMGSKKGRYGQASSWNNSGNMRAQFEKVMQLWDSRSTLPDIPSVTGFPKSVTLLNENNLDEDSSNYYLEDVENNRFELPSSDLLGAIFTHAQEKLPEDPSLFGAFQPSVLIGLGILLQEIAQAKHSEGYDVIPKRIVTALAPNIIDVLGTEVAKRDYRNKLLETLKPRRKKTRLEQLFTEI